MKKKIFSFLRLSISFKNKLKFSRTPKSKKGMNKPFMIPLLFSPFSIRQAILYLEEEEKKQESGELEFKDIIRGEYENKIRLFSPIEKKFMIFSRVKTNEELKMSYYQFLECVVPFQYMKTLKDEKVQEILEKNKLFTDIFKKIDTNNDKFISFEEFVVWFLIICFNPNRLKEKFPSGKFTRSDLSEFLFQDMDRSRILKVTDKAFADARIIKSDQDAVFRALVDFSSKYFKDTVLCIDDVEKLIIDMNLIMLFYEFYRIPSDKPNVIKGKDFAHVLVSYINIYKNKKIKKKINEGLIKLDYDVTIDQFIYFFLFLRDFSTNKFSKFNENSSYGKEELMKYSKEYLNKTAKIQGVKKEISEQQIVTLIELLDENGNGKLELEEINGILKRRNSISEPHKDFAEEGKSILDFFTKGIDFIWDNFYFWKK